MSKINKIKLTILAGVLLPLLGLSIQAFGQGSVNATLSGIVTDTSQGVLPGATVTVKNSQTGVVNSAITNSGGIYSFPSLQAGVYEVSVTMKGFQKSSKTDAKLGTGTQNRMNFELQVSGGSTDIEVSSSAENMVLETGSSTGTVLQQENVTELPLVTNDVMDLINVMGGVVKAESPVFGASSQTFAGVQAGAINVARDGISVNEIRYSSGISSPGRINPEMVGEFKMILSPVDAEMGRGAGQVQMLTKSGSNAFRGSAVWNVQNTALDANEWGNKDQLVKVVPTWRNLNNYTLSFSGPIIKNRTFFFANWDHQIARSKTSATPTVLTPCARKGIFRYLDNVNNGNATATPRSADNFRPVVNEDGTVRETFNGVTNPLKYYSVLGTLDATAQAQLNATDGTGASGNCSGYSFLKGIETLGGLDNVGSAAVRGLDTNAHVVTPWDSTGFNANNRGYRSAYDATQYVTGFSALMPQPNDWTVGDGLNTAAYRWTRTAKGIDNIYGIGEDNQRKAVTVKIDHNINSSHRISGTYSYESDFAFDAQPVWPAAYGGVATGIVDRKPQTFTSTLTSTLRPTLLNEFRVGLSRTMSHTREPLTSPEGGSELRDILLKLVPNQATLFPNYSDSPLIIGIGTGSGAVDFSGAISHPYGSARGNLPATWGGSDPRWTFADTITWTRGAHSFKGGFEFRTNKSWQEINGAISFGYGALAYPSIRGGTDWTNSPIPTLSATEYGWAGNGVYGVGGRTASGNYGLVHGLMNYMTGAVGSVNQWFYVAGTPDAPRWNIPGSKDGIAYNEQNYVTDLRNKEFSWFFKDEWKVSSSLSLNLGVRYEYYGVPSVQNGMASAVRNGINGLFGVSNTAATEDTSMMPSWMPAQLTPTAVKTDTTKMTEQFLVGNSGVTAFDRDLNNFAPHVGFAWQLPWLGKGKTTIRGGYSISYSAVANFTGYATALANNAGSAYTAALATTTANPYYNLSTIGASQVPIDLIGDPIKRARIIPTGFAKEPLDKGDQALTMYDTKVRNPYIQNLSLSLTRNIGNAITVDLRYVGTLSRKSVGTMNLNASDFMSLKVTDGVNSSNFLTEMNIIRGGGESAILNSMFPNGRLTGVAQPAAGAPRPSFSSQLRSSSGTSTPLAMGNYNSIAGTLTADNGSFPATFAQRGQFLAGNNQPYNLFIANPQYSAVNLTTNRTMANYHSMQAQITMRPTRGLSFQTTYTWSRNMSNPGSPTDWRDPKQDYWLSDMHRLHALTSYGSFDLPFGANGFILRNASGAMKKAIEGWQMSWTASLSSGIPGGISTSGTYFNMATFAAYAANSMWNNATPDIVGPFDPKSGKVAWNTEGDGRGYYFGGPNKVYRKVDDPQCSTVATALQTACKANMKALARVDNGQIVLQNPLPGNRGTFVPNSMTGPGRWSLDMALSKSIEFMEGKKIDFRIDAQNIFNHATPSGTENAATNARYTQATNPQYNLNDATNWGFINSKSGHRTFQAKIKISF